MSPKLKLTQHQKDLIRRYLTWCYKTTKESLDKIDRYFTQVQADRFVLRKLTQGESFRSSNKPYREQVEDFEQYIVKKENNALQKKYTDVERKILSPDYEYLQNRFLTIEDAIRHFLSPKELDKIREAYEAEMTNRILQAREHT